MNASLPCRRGSLRRTTWLPCLVVALGSALACQKAPAQAAQKSAAKSAAAAQAPGSFALYTVQCQKVPAVVPVLGSLTSDRRTQLSANATGRVIAVAVERGQEVQQNQVLITLDVRQATHLAKEARANLQNLQAMRTLARADCTRTEKLHEKQAISQQEYERTMAACHEADAQYEASEARNQDALRTLQDGEVRAPFAGVVSERMVNVGDYVRADSPVATLLVPDPLRLTCAVPEAYAAQTHVGSKVLFEVAAFPGREFCGEVAYIAGEVRNQTRDLLVEAIVHNPNRNLLPGMFATSSLVTGERLLPVVPKSTLCKLGEEQTVFVAKNKRLEQHVVRTGRPLGDALVAIESGLAAGDRIVLHPTPTTLDGMQVE